MVEKRLAHLADDVVLELVRDIDTMELGAQGAGDRPDFDMAVVAHPYSFAQGGERLGHEMPDAFRRLGPAQQADQALGGVIEHGAIILRGAQPAPDV